MARVEVDDVARLRTGIGELDRVLGDGLVPGSAILLGGEPGVGKSTLLLQAAAALAAAGGGGTLVATAEESAEQVALRARRLGITDPGVHVLAERDVDAIIRSAEEVGPALVVVDSIQTVATAEVAGVPGGVAQVRESAARLVHAAKDQGCAVVLVGHVTKDGSIAGPKLLEHAVDVVLSLEGESELGLRVVRGLKNRFGPAHQVGLFEMGDGGLVEIADPSRALIGDWRGRVAGSVLFPAVEGKRPLLIELQALVSRSATPQPRRSVRGVDPAKVHQLLAVMERHAGLSFTQADVYVSAVGGVRVREPAADLPIALALASSLLDRPLGAVAAWGEVGLTGEVRPVAHASRRADEAVRLGISDLVFSPDAGDRRIGDVIARCGLAVA